MKLSPEQLTVFLVSISLMLLLARMLGELMRRFKQAAIIGEILAGILLGLIMGIVMLTVAETIGAASAGGQSIRQKPRRALDGIQDGH